MHGLLFLIIQKSPACVLTSVQITSRKGTVARDITEGWLGYVIATWGAFLLFLAKISDMERYSGPVGLFVGLRWCASISETTHLDI